MTPFAAIGWIVLLIAWSGAFLTAQRGLGANKKRRVGFALWVFTNLYFSFIGYRDANWSMVITFAGYQVANLLGLYNNWGDDIEPQKTVPEGPKRL